MFFSIALTKNISNSQKNNHRHSNEQEKKIECAKYKNTEFCMDI